LRAPVSWEMVAETAAATHRPACGINNVASITSVLGPTVFKQNSEFYRRRGEEETPFC